ncbi:glycosyltransferase family 9 protein [Meridianimaribacter sp. CL38]|uniref:glycosyltransferase family 9 protein n=1 Tax=Meridianimaribacter sp. CL38 TaxID=2213021 RepID=UPI001EE00305|nr:glycosyltransferase family 9 protein [Meridianimaribacter sp. CL38]
MQDAPKHILVIRLSAMGDVAMTVNVLRAFTQQYPDVKLTVLTRAFFKPFFRDLKNVSVFHADVKHEHKGILGLYKLSKELKALKIDAVADLHNVLRSNILKTFLFGIKTVQIDKGRAEKKALVSGQEFKQLKTTHQRYADVFKTLGFPIDLSNPTFPEKKPLSKKVIETIGNAQKKRIGIAPFAAHESKMYPLDLMQEVIGQLAEKYTVLLFGGGKKEIQTLTYFESQEKGIINLAGKLTLDEELDVVSNLDVMLSMDSGNAHIAAMLGVKTMTIWGVTHPYAGFTPFNQPEDFCLLADRTQYPKIPTSVYGNKFPEDYKNAAGSIPVKTVVEKIQSVIPV